MKKMLKSILFGGLLATILAAGVITHADPAQTSGSTTTTNTAKAKRDTYPFYGTVASVDTAANTVSLQKKQGVRVLQTDASTTLQMNGKPVTLSAIQPGNYLHGTLHKNAGGQEVIHSTKIETSAPDRTKKGSVSTNSVAPVISSPATTNSTSTATNTPTKKKKKSSTSTTSTGSN